MKEEGGSITRDFTARFKRELDAATSEAEGRLGVTLSGTTKSRSAIPEDVSSSASRAQSGVY